MGGKVDNNLRQDWHLAFRKGSKAGAMTGPLLVDYETQASLRVQLGYRHVVLHTGVDPCLFYRKNFKISLM